jgi:hypothetical protein
MHEQGMEGWYTDPFERHEARWMSDGHPTKLVRDGTTESYDDPPDEPFRVPPVPVVAEVGPDDLRRADDGQGAEVGDLADRLSDAALEGGAHPEITLP